MANMQKFCPKGHAYDSSLPACPFCPPIQGGVGSTTPINNQQGGYQSGGVGPTTPVNNQQGGYQGGGVGPTTPVTNQHGGYPGGNVRPTTSGETTFTDELISQINNSPIQQPTSEHIRPVVGWLVCVQGPDIGKDFRLHSDFNHVGRDKYQDVCLSDRTVSREHFTVSYDIVNNHYFAEMDKGRTMVYINGYSLGGRALLKKGDQIKVGETLLVFIPLEQKDVKWNWRT